MDDGSSAVELDAFERELRAAGLKESSVHTYVERSSRVLRHLTGDCKPRGPRVLGGRGHLVSPRSAASPKTLTSFSVNTGFAFMINFFSPRGPTNRTP